MILYRQRKQINYHYYLLHLKYQNNFKINIFSLFTMTMTIRMTMIKSLLSHLVLTFPIFINHYNQGFILNHRIPYIMYLVWNLLAYQRKRFDINHNSSIMTYAKPHPLSHVHFNGHFALSLTMVCESIVIL